jgi:hypothetical protein
MTDGAVKAIINAALTHQNFCMIATKCCLCFRQGGTAPTTETVREKYQPQQTL